MQRQLLTGIGSIGALVLAYVLSIATATVSPAAPKIPRTIETSGVDFITPAAQQSLDRGLAYLAAQQNDDGSFGSGTVFSHNIAVTALSGIALSQQGILPAAASMAGR